MRVPTLNLWGLASSDNNNNNNNNLCAGPGFPLNSISMYVDIYVCC